MKGRKKIAIAAALVCVVLGLILSVSALAMIDFDYTQLNTLAFETNTYDVTEDFFHIRVDGAECTIRLVPSQDGACRVVCQEGDQISHSVTVQHDTLTITRTDERAWYEHIGVYWGEMSITVYLPAREYGELNLKTLSGDILIPSDFSFSQAELQSSSGGIDYSAATGQRLSVNTVSGDLRVLNQTASALQTQTTSGDTELFHVRTDTLQASSTSGDIQISSSQASGGVTVETVSGEVELEHLEAASLTAHASSGDIRLSDVIAAGPVEIETVSGAIGLERCDAGKLWLKSTSGDVSGALRSEKWFVTSTTSGAVRVPDSSPNGGKCEITTTSGDIRFSVTG